MERGPRPVSGPRPPALKDNIGRSRKTFRRSRNKNVTGYGLSLTRSRLCHETNRVSMPAVIRSEVTPPEVPLSFGRRSSASEATPVPSAVAKSTAAPYRLRRRKLLRPPSAAKTKSMKTSLPSERKTKGRIIAKKLTVRSGRFVNSCVVLWSSAYR